MPKGSNQKLKLSYLCKIMQEKPDDDFAVMNDKLGIEVIKEQIGRETFYHKLK